MSILPFIFTIYVRGFMGLLFIAMIAFIFFTFFGAIHYHHKMSCIAKDRGCADIDTFTRELGSRIVDDVVLKLVFEKTQKQVGCYNGEPFPVKINDNFVDLYKWCPEEFEEFIFELAGVLSIELIDVENPGLSKSR